MNETIQIIVQGLLAIVISAVGFIVRQLASKLDKFSDSLEILARAISDLRVEMLKDFVRNEEFSVMRQRIHDIANNVAALMAQAELNKRKGER
jgi:hypothetical protein